MNQLAINTSDIMSIISKLNDAVRCNQTEIYNEFSLQHELGSLIRLLYPGLKIQFERNASYFFGHKKQFVKKEIDIAVFSYDKTALNCAIELKYPKNGQYPEQMFSFCKDICFAEQLKTAGFSNAYVVIFADDPLFYAGKGTGIYEYFRKCKPLSGTIQKPTGPKDASVELKGTYDIQWRPIQDNKHYAVIEAANIR